MRGLTTIKTLRGPSGSVNRIPRSPISRENSTRPAIAAVEKVWALAATVEKHSSGCRAR